MRNLILVLIVSLITIACSPHEDFNKSIVGNWDCGSYQVGDKDVFNINSLLFYKESGTVIQVDTWQSVAQEDVWVILRYSGNWKITEETLTESFSAPELVEYSEHYIIEPEKLELLKRKMPTFDSENDFNIISITSNTLKANDEYGPITCKSIKQI